MSFERLDTLTHCLSPRFFRTELADAVSRGRKLGSPVCVIWFDVDECEVANQDHGVGRVDEALARLGLALKAMVGPRGTVGRLQGAAFAVLLPGFTREAALELGELLRRAAGAIEHPAESVPFELKLSGSVLQAMPNELALNLLDAAEILSVRAKQAGRDQLLLR